MTYDSPVTRPQTGEVAPRFSMTADDGALVTNDGLAGQRYVLYFYPKDDTPGCATTGAASRTPAFNSSESRPIR